jgi:predicted DsbA family dithiol-disulfide isomerase
VKALIFADVTDPWSYIGAVRFERAAALFTILTGYAIDISYRAFMREPNEDRGGEPYMQVMAERLGGVDKVELLNARVTAGAKITGVDLNFPEAVIANTFDAWRLLSWAREEGSHVQRDLLHQLWRAHFLEGADVGDHFTLATRAALVGLDLESAEGLLASDEYADKVKLQVETAVDLGVEDLPHVIIDQKWTLAGVKSQNDYVQVLHTIHRGGSVD